MQTYTIFLINLTQIQLIGKLPTAIANRLKSQTEPEFKDNGRKEQKSVAYLMNINSSFFSSSNYFYQFRPTNLIDQIEV